MPHPPGEALVYYQGALTAALKIALTASSWWGNLAELPMSKPEADISRAKLEVAPDAKSGDYLF